MKGIKNGHHTGKTTSQNLVLETKFLLPQGTEKRPPFCRAAIGLPTGFDCQEAQD